MIYQLVSSDSIESISAYNLLPQTISIDKATFEMSMDGITYFTSLIQENGRAILLCECNGTTGKLCIHQARVLFSILKRQDLLVFFNEKLRHERLKKTAYEYGLGETSDLDKHFQLTFSQNRLIITTKDPALTPVTREHLSALSNAVIGQGNNPAEQLNSENAFVVLRPNKYYKHLELDLCEALRTKQGKIKKPITIHNPHELLWTDHNTDFLKFLIGIGKLHQRANSALHQHDIAALKAVLKNPKLLPFFTTDKTALSATDLIAIEIRQLESEIVLNVAQHKDTYDISASVSIDNQTYAIADLQVKFQVFLVVEKTWYLIDKLPVITFINHLKKQAGHMIIYQSGYQEFKTQFLHQVSDYIKVNYQYVQKVSPKQLIASEYWSDMEKIIYLSDFGPHVMIMPVMRYSDAEIPVRTKRLIYGKDENGGEFLVDRNTKEETELTALLIKQHPDFHEQLENELDHFYLHKRQFLNEEWFLPTFEEWEKHGITVLGFNELEGAKMNPHRVTIDIKVSSGLNWFNAKVNARFGRKKTSVKKVQVAVKNKSKYVQLDDGTLGILPKEWIDKFSAYFTAGDISGEDEISIPKVNFSQVEELFDEEMLEPDARLYIKELNQKVKDFTALEKVKVPAGLKGTLRGYQQEGLNWLNFLDTFGFGGCLADDMGLGKSIQIIAFMLLQKSKKTNCTNLLVVPTTLIFNWEAELERFAPGLSIFTLQGTSRVKKTDGFERYDLILTSYTTLITDINYLRNFQFHYVFLDESQQIKNPETQRYKAARMLQSYNRIAITGTPVENNTFDIYSQFSFACPGLFGNKRHFKELYSVPIDQFKNSKRARELQEKIKPFLLRRTKEDVARELPQKTEMILYCPMDQEQKATYDLYEKEFRDFISATEAEDLEKSPMYVLRGLTKLRQICNSTRLLKSDEVLGKKTSSKIEALMEQIENNIAHHKILIFSQFVSMLELIKSELESKDIGYTMLTGRTKNREAIVKSFQNEEQVRVGLISLKAGGVGLNLVEASYVYLVDPWWNPAVENQAIDRVYRIGQTKNVTAIRLICPQTVEEKIMLLQQAKKELTGKLITDSSPILQGLDKSQLLKLLS